MENSDDGSANDDVGDMVMMVTIARGFWLSL